MIRTKLVHPWELEPVLRAYYPTHAVPTTEAASSELLPRQRVQETDLGSVPETISHDGEAYP